jgi:hypothetical protein
MIGFAHKRCFVMDLYIGDGLLNSSLTLVGCLHDILL